VCHNIHTNMHGYINPPIAGSLSTQSAAAASSRSLDDDRLGVYSESRKSAWSISMNERRAECEAN
jgi:hypothetical protein